MHLADAQQLAYLHESVQSAMLSPADWPQLMNGFGGMGAPHVECAAAPDSDSAGLGEASVITTSNGSDREPLCQRHGLQEASAPQRGAPLRLLVLERVMRLCQWCGLQGMHSQGCRRTEGWACGVQRRACRYRRRRARDARTMRLSTPSRSAASARSGWRSREPSGELFIHCCLPLLLSGLVHRPQIMFLSEAFSTLSMVCLPP